MQFEERGQREFWKT